MRGSRVRGAVGPRIPATISAVWLVRRASEVTMVSGWRLSACIRSPIVAEVLVAAPGQGAGVVAARGALFGLPVPQQ